MSANVHAFGQKALVVVELGLPVIAGMIEQAAETLQSLLAIDAKMAAAVKEVLEELDPAIVAREFNLGSCSAREIQIVGIERIMVNPFWMQIDVKVLMYPNGAAAEPKEFVFRSIRWLRGVENGVAVLPLTVDKRIVLIREFKHATRRWCLHLPRGVKKDGESNEDCGLREAGEEGGVSTSASSTVVDLGPIEPDTGVLSSRPRLLLATDVVIDESRVNLDPTETIAGTTVLSWNEVCELIRRGEIIDSFTEAALFRAFLRGYLS